MCSQNILKNKEVLKFNESYSYFVSENVYKQGKSLEISNNIRDSICYNQHLFVGIYITAF